MSEYLNFRNLNGRCKKCRGKKLALINFPSRQEGGKERSVNVTRNRQRDILEGIVRKVMRQGVIRRPGSDSELVGVGVIRRVSKPEETLIKS